MKQLANRYWWMLPVVVLVAAALVAVQLLQPDREPAAGELVDCATESPDDYACWRDRLHQLVAEESPGAALDDARSAYDGGNSFVIGQCHQLAHEIGRAAGDRYGDVADAYAEGDDFCSSGYYHGVIEAISEQLGPEELIAQVETVCAGPKAEAAYGLAHYNCVHGLGHGLMAVTEVELFESLEGCDGYADSWERESCYGGVFMENIMASNGPHHTTQYLHEDDPLYPCTEVADVYKNQCWLMHTSHLLTVFGYDFAQVFEACSEPEVEPYQATCFESLGRDVSGNAISDVDRTIELCLLGETELAQRHCFIGAAKDFVYYYHGDTEALELCAAIEDAEMSEVCRDTVVTFWGNM